MCAPEKSGASQFCPLGIGRAICPGLTSHDASNHQSLATGTFPKLF